MDSILLQRNEVAALAAELALKQEEARAEAAELGEKASRLAALESRLLVMQLPCSYPFLQLTSIY